MMAPGPDGAVLELCDVHKSFDDHAGMRRVLRGVDLTLQRGEIVAVVGRSGSGKTTLLTLVAGFERPDAGSIRLLGSGAPPASRPWAELAVLPQSLGLLGELTVLENIALPRRFAEPVEAAEGTGVMALMERLGIDRLADRLPSEISLGEQQRTALARAVALGPRVLLADEPISHQNQAWAVAMMELLVDLAAAGTACLLATHNEIAVGVAQRVLELHAGRLR